MKMDDKQFEDLIQEMADFSAEYTAEEQTSKEEEARQRAEFHETLGRVRDMLSSKAFQRKCKEQAKKYGVSEKHIKNVYAAKVLNKIGLTGTALLEVMAEAFNYLVRFVSYVLQRIMDLAVSVLCKLVNILTFRKEVA